MATSSEPVSLGERPDVHKACKSLETLLNVLNDYCEAIGNVTVLQKKLAKALRETAGMKMTGGIAAKAMNSSAVIFEALSDIDAKFAKVADKEYDGISTEVKKWFKKLAKEEKAHDEKMANANAKIKHAGQIYEKKSKKGARDVPEEHTRYINLISILGPEMSQEKYNHALNVTQRHTSTTYSAAACLSRVADAEWLRAFEGVRRLSPVIGQLGEWRALCEGGWIGPIPQALPNLDESQQPYPDHELQNQKRYEGTELQAPNILRNVEARESSREIAQRLLPPANDIPSGTEQSEGFLPPPRQSQPNQSYPSSESIVEDRVNSANSLPFDPSPPRAFTDHNSDTVRSLSAFPSPPTFFPLPPPRQQQSSQSQSSQSSSYLKPRLTESPLPEQEGDGAEAEFSSSPLELQRGNPSAQQLFQERYPITDVVHATSAGPSEDKDKLPISPDAHPPSPSAPSSNTVEASTMPGAFNSPAPAHRRGDYLDAMDEREFGANPGYKPEARDNVTSASMDRSDASGSNNSVAATMRHRLSTAAGSPSTTLKDVPRLPLSVNDLASRYQPGHGPSSPRPGPSSLPPLRQLPVLPPTPRTPPRQSNSYQERMPHNPEPPTLTTGANSVKDEASQWRRQEMDELAELELKQKQTELWEQERVIEMRARELERDRLHSMNAREEDGLANTNTNEGSRRNPEPHFQPLRPLRPRSQMDLAQASANASYNLTPLSPLRPRFSQSSSYLIPPSPSRNSPQPFNSPDSGSAYLHSDSSSRQSSQHREDKPPHAPSCGCETCSVAKYRTPSPAAPPLDRPPTKPLSIRPVEKPRPGWIRRLSVPVGNAFNLDSKKSIGNLGGLGSVKNRSTSSFGLQDGRSYEASSMNLGERQ